MELNDECGSLNLMTVIWDAFISVQDDTTPISDGLYINCTTSILSSFWWIWGLINCVMYWLQLLHLIFSSMLCHYGSPNSATSQVCFMIESISFQSILCKYRYQLTCSWTSKCFSLKFLFVSYQLILCFLNFYLSMLEHLFLMKYILRR